MLRDVLESEVDDPRNRNEWACIPSNKNTKLKQRTRGDGVVGVGALSADADDRSTRCR